MHASVYLVLTYVIFCIQNEVNESEMAFAKGEKYLQILELLEKNLGLLSALWS